MGRPYGQWIRWAVVSATLVARGLGAGHGERVLFSNLYLVVAPGGPERCGQVDPLRTRGEQRPEQGRVSISPPDATVGYLPQHTSWDETVADYLARDWAWPSPSGGWTLPPRRWPPAGADDEYAQALDRWLALGGAYLVERTGQYPHRGRP